MAVKHLQLLRGLLSKLSKGTLKMGEPYVITDKHKLAVGDTGTDNGYFICADDTEVQNLATSVTYIETDIADIQTDYMQTAGGNTITANAVAVSNTDGKLTAVKGTSGQVITFNESGVPVATTLSTGGVKKYTTTIGNGSSTSYTVTHSLNTTDICVNAVQVSSNQNVWIQYTINNANQITLSFSAAVASNSIKVVVMG